jgi:hypothetical protein
MEHKTHEEYISCEAQVKHKIKMMEFTGLALGCLVAAPFVPVLATVGLLGVGSYALFKGAKESVYADNTHKLFMALHNEKNIASPEYKELSRISKDFSNIENLSIDQIKNHGDKVDELTKAKEYRTYEEFLAFDRQIKHKTGVLKFATLGIGCLMAAPFAGPVLTMGLVGAGILALGKGLEKTFYAESTHELSWAMHKQMNTNSSDYKELSEISKDFKDIENLSINGIRARTAKIKAINEKVAKIRDNSINDNSSVNIVKNRLT